MSRTEHWAHHCEFGYPHDGCICKIKPGEDVDISQIKCDTPKAHRISSDDAAAEIREALKPEPFSTEMDLAKEYVRPNDLRRAMGLPEADEDTEEQEIRVTSSTGAQKGTKIERFDLIPVGPLKALAKHYGIGARKYAERNWEGGYDWSLSYAAMQRHANDFWNGVDIDEETGAHQMACVMFHAMALLEFATTHPEFDNRPTTEKDIPNA